MTAQPGDIVLYSGNQLVVFFGSNSWSYTKLGHINDLSADELTVLLDKDQTVIELQIKSKLATDSKVTYLRAEKTAGGLILRSLCLSAVLDLRGCIYTRAT